MRIIDNSIEVVALNDLCPGDTFRFTEEAGIFLLTDNMTSGCEVVRLTDGQIMFVGGDDYVIQVEGVFTVKKVGKK